jgi:acetylornithine deacetylase/succinyl-diaminopimelate desuccinylase-like protein
MFRSLLTVLVVAVPTLLYAQTGAPQVDWARMDAETLAHFQALLRMDTSDPPGNERPAAAYIQDVLTKEGISFQTFELEPNRPNVVARLKGSGRKRPLLMMGHTDTVNVDPSKWTFPPFAATRDGGYIYGRGTVDDKDNVVASLMTMVLLKRLNVPLDRDVIFLAESGEEGTTRVGIGFMVAQHYAEIDAEYCLAEGGGVSRSGGRVQFASAQTAEKIPRAIELIANGTAGHGSVPLQNNALLHLAKAVAALGDWKPPIRLNETTRTYFERLATFSLPQDAARYRAVLNPASKAAADAVDYFAANEPSRASMLRSSLSPTIFQGGYRVNVIPSEAKATIDVRLAPADEADAFLEAARAIVNDPMVTVGWAPRDVRPAAPPSSLESEVFKQLESSVVRHYDTTVVPTMSTGATDMSYLRAKGMQCYGIGPATDVEDGPKGFGAHSDQERILESELYRFVHFNWDVVSSLVRSR